MSQVFIFNRPSIKNRRRELRKTSTDAERKLWSKLRNRQLFGLRFFRQYGIGSYIADFYCPKEKLAIEIDGGQHAEAKQELYDKKRSDYLRKRNIQVLRFWNNEVLRNINGVILKITEIITPPNLPLI